jgi:flavin-dependent dehydrogenase
MKVVIIGAGPAGLISALNLIQEGIRPVILEKKSAIRSTACAEACGLQSLSKIPFNSNPYIRKEVKGAKIIYPDGTHSYMKKSAAILDRKSWLMGMAEDVIARGGQIRFNSEVLAIESNNTQLKAGEKIDHEILIGSDGPFSLVARHLGIRHQLVIASQYKLICDTSGMEYMEFFFDKRFSRGYSWVFPRDGIINVGLEGDFAQLDAFLNHKGLSSYKIIKREAGIIPASGIQRLVRHNIALIGDAAAITNPMSGAGLTPIIYASQILARNIRNLDDYEREVKKHAMAAPVLVKTRQTLLGLADKDVTNLLSFLIEPYPGKRLFPLRTIKFLPLLKKPRLLMQMYQALRISKAYGW